MRYLSWASTRTAAMFHLLQLFTAGVEASFATMLAFSNADIQPLIISACACISADPVDSVSNTANGRCGCLLNWGESCG